MQLRIHSKKIQLFSENINEVAYIVGDSIFANIFIKIVKSQKKLNNSIFSNLKHSCVVQLKISYV